jgi:hypothetical protein
MTRLQFEAFPSARLRCAWTLWAVSGRHPAPRPRDWRPRPARLLAPLSPPADRPRVPCACSPLIWSPGGRSPQPPTPEKPVRTPEGSGRLGCSHLSRRPPIAPGSPRPTSPFPTIVLPMFCARHRTLAPIRSQRPADAGVCASRSGGGTSDNRTLPEYSPRPACDGGGHCATAGTPTQHAVYACGV